MLFAKELPLISVIMPAYNASKFISRAIESVLSQTYPKIELVISDDASTDNTCKIVERYQDDRIKLIKGEINSGSAYLPRYRAYMQSSGEYVLVLDSDDYLESTYVAQLVQRLLKFQADVVCGWMVFVDEEGNLLGEDDCVPKSSFDFNCRMTGREAFFNTVVGWKIGLNGCIAKREAWEYGYKRTYKTGKRGIHDDENVSRYILLWAKKVVFSKAKYFYTINQASVTHVFNERIFDFMRSEVDLLRYIDEDFGRDSNEYQAVEADAYTVFFYVRGEILNAINCMAEKELIWYLKELRKWHRRLNWHAASKYENNRCCWLEEYYWISIGLRLLKRRQVKMLAKLAVRKVINTFAEVKNNRYYRWYIYRVEREKMIRAQIENKYQMHGGKYKPFVISICDETVRSGGLADRLRGIISVYAVCKEKGLPYRIHFTKPFDLSLFLEPNEYDWRVKANEVCRDIEQVETVVLDTTEDSPFQFAKQGKYLQKRLHLKNKQIQVFSNAAYAYTLDYAKLFNELFRPTPRLGKALEREKKKLGPRYISVSARFLDLLGDFNEPDGYGECLSLNEAEALIQGVLAEIEKIHHESPKGTILVNSDSTRFLAAANELSYTYIAPGVVTHIDNENSDNAYEHYEKTFLDFLLIAGASEVVLLRSGKMHHSGFPYAASLLYARPFREVNF